VEDSTVSAPERAAGEEHTASQPAPLAGGARDPQQQFSCPLWSPGGDPAALEARGAPAVVQLPTMEFLLISWCHQQQLWTKTERRCRVLVYGKAGQPAIGSQSRPHPSSSGLQPRQHQPQHGGVASWQLTGCPSSRDGNDHSGGPSGWPKGRVAAAAYLVSSGPASVLQPLGWPPFFPDGVEHDLLQQVLLSVELALYPGICGLSFFYCGPQAASYGSPWPLASWSHHLAPEVPVQHHLALPSPLGPGFWPSCLASKGLEAGVGSSTLQSKDPGGAM